MKRSISLLAILCFITLLPSFVKAQGRAPVLNPVENPEYQAGRLYVKVKSSSSFELLGYPSAPLVSDPEMLTVMHRYGVSKVEKPFAAFRSDYFDRTYRFTFESSANVENLMHDLASIDYIDFSEKVPAIYEQIIDPIQPYHLNLLNAAGAAAIHISTGTSIVAIVDDAVMITHDDLTANVGALNYDVADLDTNPNPPFTGPAAATNGHTFSHGTHVAGIAGARTDNGIGVASIGYNNTLMCIKTRSDSDPGNGLPFVYDGVTWAATHGAHVINMSWGGTVYSSVEYNVILAARNMNIVMVAAAGNNYMINPFYPAAYGEGTTGQVWETYDRTTVIAVAGLDANNDISNWGANFMGQSGSNYGQWVDISAYGTNIISSVANSTGGTPINNQYLAYDGTSMAAPQVSGIAGIMHSLNPAATATDIYNCLVYTANPDIYNSTLHPANLPGMLGTGRADAEAALKCIDITCPNAIAVIVPSAMSLCAGDTVTLTANTGTSYLWSTGATTQTINVTTAGTYTVTVTFAGGCTASTSVTIHTADTQAHIIVTETSGLAPNDGIMCGLDMLQLASYSGLTYQWSAFGFTTPAIPGTINAGLSLPFPWTVCVYISGVGGCVGVLDTACVDVLWRLPPTVTVSPVSPTICAGQSVTLTASGADTYTWLPATGLSCSNCANPLASPGSTTTYTVTGVDTAGCSSTATVTVTVNPLPVLTFTPVPPLCAGSGAYTLTASPTGGTFSGTNVSGSTFTPPPVVIPTGYIVTYTYTDPNGCTADTSQLITVNPPSTLVISYTGSPYCQNTANPLPTVSGGTASSFSSTAGLVFVSTATGQINLAASTPGTYTISAVGGCPAATSTTTITITAPAAATFSYASPFCQTGTNPSPAFSGGGIAGTFSSTAGLVFVSTATGQINLSASTAGTYTITNTIAASGGCPAITATSTITINAPAPSAAFSYTGSPFCQTGTNPLPTFTIGVAGTFSSTAGLVFVNTSTGEINLAASTPGTYTITNIVYAGWPCFSSSYVYTITITAPATATFSYTGSPYCKTAANPSPTFSGGGTAGTFSSTAGLVFVSTSTGQVNLAASTAGTYTVTNTIAAGGCPAVIATATITITPAAVATFSYTGTPYCKTAANPSPTFSGGGFAGTFSSTAGLVFVSTSTGQVNLAASTAGTYTVTNTIAASGGCPTATATATITITTPAVATFSYTGSPYCFATGYPLPTFTGGGVAGTFSSTAGLVFVSTGTGQINITLSTPGTYTVTNTIAATGGCTAVTATSTITITPAAVATFSYTGSPYCKTAANPSPTFTGSGFAGTFSSTAGLVFVSTSTGQVNLAASTAGTYTVTNTIAASGGCPAASASATIIITTPAVATFSYTASPYCKTAANPSPAFSGGGVAGTFSSTTGLVFVSTATGQVNLAASTAGTYTVTNTIAASGGCAAVTATATITITPAAVATFSYTGSPYCKNAANPFPTFSGGGVAGTFSSTTGLAFVSTATGQVNLAASTAGTYTVTNTIAASGGCPAATATATITITPLAVATFSYTGSPYCKTAANPSPVFSGGGVAGTFSSTTGLVFVSTGTGQINLAASTAGTYTVTNTIAATGGCPAVTATATITITPAAVATFSYTGSPYCQSAANPAPAFTGGGVAGTFSSTTGLVFVSTSTGQVNLAASTAGTYTVTNTIAASGGCAAVIATATITIYALPPVTFTTPGTVCSAGPPLTLTTGSPAGGTYGGLYVSGGVFTPPTVSIPTTYMLSYTYTNPITGCSNTATTTINVTVCPAACGSCPSTLDALATGGVLSTTPAGGVVYCLNNNIAISGTVSITLCEVRIAPGVTITVTPGANLTILGSHLYSCADMWQGIVVQPGGTIAVQNFIIGTFINRSSLIEDARVAIDVLSGSTVTTNLVNVNNATFNRNEIGIRVMDYTPALATYPFTIVNTVFTSRDIPFTPGSIAWPQTGSIKATYTVFNPLQTPYINDATYPDNTTAAYLKAPFTPGISKPAAHIKLLRVGQTINPATTPTYYEMMIGATGTGIYNIFDNMVFGIDGMDANFTCVNNVFQRTIGTQKGSTAINVVARESTNSRLQVLPASGTSFVNLFYDCGRSIVATNYFEVNAKYCEVRSLQNFALQFNTPHRGQNGFIINTNRYIAINLSNNMFANIENAIMFQSNIGFYSVGPFTSSSGQYSGKVDINSNTFQAFMPTFPLTGSYLNKAIVANNITGSTYFVNPAYVVNTNNNTLRDVHNGIRLMNWQKKNVLTNNNSITMVAVPGAPTTQYGISHANNIPITAMGNNVKSNDITGFGITNPNIVGIATQLCNNQVVNCNLTKNITMGIYFAGNETPTIFSNNTFDNGGTNRHKYAYVLDNAIIGQQGNGPGTSGSPVAPSDNKWSGVWTTFTNYKTLVMNGAIATNSKLWVRSPTINNPVGPGYNTSIPFVPANEYNATGAINITTFPSLATGCPISICIPCITPSMITLMEQIAEDRIDYPVNKAMTKVIGKNQLYRMLKSDPSYMATSTILQDFYRNSQTTNRENFDAIEEHFVNGEFTDARAKIDMITGSSAAEKNYKDFYTIYLNQQTDTLVDADSITLYKLSSGCPFIDGPVVFQARALYNAVYDVNKDFIDNCTYTTDRELEIAEPETATFDAILFPNPATNDVYIAPKNLVDERILVDVKDISGKTVYREQLLLSGGISNFKLNINNGVYFVYITSSSTNETIIKKLVIQK